jgi:DNA-binding MarR family transcriptional regulator
MDEALQAYREWADVGEEERAKDFRAYAYNIAEARYVMRRITRILNDQAKQHGFDPLLHQALLQIYGTVPGEHLAINGLAERLDIPAAFASRLVSKLESQGLARREASERDRRVTNVSITEAGLRELKEIDADVHHHVAYFQHQLSEDQRVAALSIFAFYVGVDPKSAIARALRPTAAS